MVVDNFDKLFKAVSDAKIENSTTSKDEDEQDRANILKLVRGTARYDPPYGIRPTIKS